LVQKKELSLRVTASAQQKKNRRGPLRGVKWEKKMKGNHHGDYNRGRPPGS